MEDEKEKIINVPVEDILPNRFQPRLAFDEKELNELSNSILKYGVIQPIVLRKIGDKYEIVAGERRYKATILAGLKTIPSIIKNTDDNTSAEIALLENLQRKNLTVIEEAQSFKKLIDRGFRQEEIANKLGISQSSIANKIRLLNLPRKVQDALLYNKISERHARSLLSLNNSEEQLELLERIINERLTVRQTEEEIEKLVLKKDEFDIPEDIMRLIDKKEPIIEIKEEDSKITNQNENHVFNNSIPIQFENNLRKIEEQISGKENSYYDDIINKNINIKDFEELRENIKDNEVVLKEEKREIYLPNFILDIRNTIKKYDEEKVNIKENNLDSKYQIIIEVDKNE